jgi:radical SAM superfamily enzyme YgiQ (UPF0313 family)
MNIILADTHGPVMGKDQISPNLSLLYLAAYAKQHLPEINFTYISQVHLPEYHFEKIETLKPAIYACSFTSYSARKTHELINGIKRRYPHLLIVSGGPHVTNSPYDTLSRSKTDICVIGEGEITFLEIIKHLDHLNEWLPGIDGIAYRDGDTFRRSKDRALINNIDEIPFPDRGLVNDADFRGLPYSQARPNTEMIATRGCPLRCTFCANPVFRVTGGALFRNRSPKNIASEVEALYQRGYREIYIHSDELNMSLNWSIEVCKELAALNHPDLFFQCNVRALPMNEELAMWMKKANFWLVRMGIESTNDRVLKGIKKQMSLQQTERSITLLSQAGIKVFAFLMLFSYWEEDGKLMHETAGEVNNTIKTIYGFWRRGILHYASWAFCCPVQGAELYDIAIKYGMVDDNFYPSDVWDSFTHLKGVSRRQFNSLYARARRQQAIMALTGGNFEWRNYKGIMHKTYTMFFGQNKKTSDA